MKWLHKVATNRIPEECQDMRYIHPPPKTEEQVIATQRMVCLLLFPAGLSCLKEMFSVVCFCFQGGSTTNGIARHS